MGQRQPASDQETEKENFGATRLTHEQKQVLSARCTEVKINQNLKILLPHVCAQISWHLTQKMRSWTETQEILDRHLAQESSSGRTEPPTPER
jgi:hypothetical protein